MSPPWGGVEARCRIWRGCEAEDGDLRCGGEGAVGEATLGGLAHWFDGPFVPSEVPDVESSSPLPTEAAAGGAGVLRLATAPVPPLPLV